MPIAIKLPKATKGKKKLQLRKKIVLLGFVGFVVADMCCDALNSNFE